jgi:6-phosphogluconolactonase (cycloisomerase 2 family)
LGNQGGLILERHLLYAVNAGSDEISVMREDGGQLTLVSKVSSGGAMPISIAVHRDLLYVLNAGGTGNITGFTGARSGALSSLSGSTRPLSGNAVGPAQVGFSPDGRVLVVTEKATNKIDTYTVGRDGMASGPNVQNSTGDTPFGFAFTKRGQLVVSDAFGGAAGLSALSSYRVNRNGLINLITGPVSNGQAAACWVAITKNGKFAYTTNTATSNISGYRVDRHGRLRLLDASGITATSDAAPIDMALSRNSRYLYVLNAAGQSITIYSVGANGLAAK